MCIAYMHLETTKCTLERPDWQCCCPWHCSKYDKANGQSKGGLCPFLTDVLCALLHTESSYFEKIAQILCAIVCKSVCMCKQMCTCALFCTGCANYRQSAHRDIYIHYSYITPSLPVCTKLWRTKFWPTWFLQIRNHLLQLAVERLEIRVRSNG